MDGSRFFDLAIKGLLSNFKQLEFPYKLTFAVTYRCNAKCKICNIWKNPSKNELTLDEIEEFTKNSKFKWVNLTGGEPFIRKDLFEIIKLFEKYNHPYIINCTTNGYFTSKILDYVEYILKKLKIPRFILVVSIDGPCELHDKLRGIKIWNNAVNTFKELRKFSKKYKNFSTYIGFTLSQFNFGKLEETFYSIKSIIPDLLPEEFHINFVHLSEIFYKNVNLKIPKNFELRIYEEIINFWKTRHKKYFNIVNFLEWKYITLLKQYLETNQIPLSCKALNSSIFIDPIGNIYPCTIFNKKLANLREIDYDIKKIWNSKQTKEIRKLIKYKRCPQCWTPCEAYQTIVGNINRWLI
jgi:radical SAM protein with 4Fe4S-binding SPASM domain